MVCIVCFKVVKSLVNWVKFCCSLALFCVDCSSLVIEICNLFNDCVISVLSLVGNFSNLVKAVFRRFCKAVNSSLPVLSVATSDFCSSLNITLGCGLL